MGYAEEFAPVDLILKSGARTLAVDAFALSLIKLERQARKLFTHLVFQFPAFGSDDKNRLRGILAGNKDVYFEGVVTGLNRLAPVSVRSLVGKEYDYLWKRFVLFKKYRNKIFHGQVSVDQLSRPLLLEYTRDIRRWCSLLADGAKRELRYDGFERNSLRKTGSERLARRCRVELRSLEDYKRFIEEHMERDHQRSRHPLAAAS